MYIHKINYGKSKKMKDTLSGLSSKLFSKNDDKKTITENETNIAKADSNLIIPPKDRGGWWTNFLVAQSGGYDPKYYTKSEAKGTTVLAAAKFVSVSLATYAFMKAVSPAFENESLSTLPTVGNTDPRFILAGGVATGLWWGISKLDTAIMHSMRARKVSQYVADNLGVNIKGKEGSFTGMLFRLGISAGSLGITIPALMITASEDTVNQYIQDKNNADNAPIILEYQEQLDSVDGYIEQLRNNLATLQQSLEQTHGAGAFVTEIQQSRIDTLNAELARLQAQEIEEQERLAAETIIRDEALARIQQERDGTRGSNPGCRPEVREAPDCDEAMADRDDALRRMGTIQATLDRITSRISGIETDLADINTSITEATEASREAIIAQRESLERQIETAERQLTRQLTLRESVVNVTERAEADPRYNHFNPDLAEQAEAYVDYMMEEANPLEWGRAVCMALIIASLELGVFALSSSRRVNPGEVRGYLADIAKSEEAANLYHELVAKNEAQKQDDVANSLDAVKKRKIMEVDMQTFEQVIEKMKADPTIFEEALADAMNLREKMRLKSNDNDKDAEEALAQKPRTPGNSPA